MTEQQFLNDQTSSENGDSEIHDKVPPVQAPPRIVRPPESDDDYHDRSSNHSSSTNNNRRRSSSVIDKLSLKKPILEHATHSQMPHKSKPNQILDLSFDDIEQQLTQAKI
mmetsp:Transcript_43219/g.31556  ORF Transcript_43219/g.31556 Transcript_43219/m.31556 type:complete len:110 (-) Transcript_43219:814-1143(-)|eukprot:CAMPEP_0202979532 /NCGR_PEP_ID=MMETSP1396-20130829/85647_1 /ASSEMBLY_ACC=CAM_ASM_000872 /TAXON_ID= /ORGANISM="Pseudokeronopsis sp., Strain Brazil" /LENGTH=109 /DNA_ID=CAMNT_0049718989 /DNA_START=751 /DNA_END=1080 /DNA_ORIENTATION=-